MRNLFKRVGIFQTSNEADPLRVLFVDKFAYICAFRNIFRGQRPHVLPAFIRPRMPSCPLGFLHLDPDSLSTFDHVHPRYLSLRPHLRPPRLQRRALRLVGCGCRLRAGDLLSRLLKENAVQDPRLGEDGR